MPEQSDACTAVNELWDISKLWSLFSTSSRDPGDSLNDCTIILVDEIYKIEEPGTASPISSGTPKRECFMEFLARLSYLVLSCQLSLWGSKLWELQDTFLGASLTISTGSWPWLSVFCVCPQDRVAPCVKPARTTPTRPAGSVPVTSVGENRTQTSSWCVTSVTWPSTSTAWTLPSAGSPMRTGGFSGGLWGVLIKSN